MLVKKFPMKTRHTWIAFLALVLVVFGGGFVAFAGTLTLAGSGTTATPAILGYNHGYYNAGSNARAWWEYAGVNGVRIFITASTMGPYDKVTDAAHWGAGVNSDATFESRKAALRVDPFNPTYLDWVYFSNKLSSWNFMLSQYRSLGQEIMIQASCSPASFPITNSADYAGRWELWQTYYASSFNYARYYDIQHYQMYNEPNAVGATLTDMDWLLRLQIASDAIKCAITDVNRRYGKSLQAVIHAPVSAGYQYASGCWGDVAVTNRHLNYRGVTSSTNWIMDRYDFHQYDASGAGAFNSVSGIIGHLNTDMAGETRFPICISEFNVHTAANFNLIPETLDSPTMYTRFGVIACNHARAGARELFCFKFTETGKNGMFYADKTHAPNNHGGASKSAEVYRLFLKGLAPGRIMKNFTATGFGVDANGLTIPTFRFGYDSVTQNYYVFSVNETANPIPIKVDTTALNLPVNNRVLLEEVSESCFGAGRNWGAIGADKMLTDGSTNAFTQPPYSVWLWTLPGNVQQTEETFIAAEDATVCDGTNAAINYGSAATLVAQNDPASADNRSAAFLKFNLPKVYRPDIQLAVLCLNTRATASGTAQGYVYGLDTNAWSENAITWSNAPNLKQGMAAGNQIANRVIAGEGDTARILGQLVATATNSSVKMIDVTEFLRSRPNGTMSFLIPQDPRWDGIYPDTTGGDTQAAALEITSKEGGTAPYLKIVRLANTLNTPPTISNVSDQSVNENTSTAPIPFTVGDSNTAADLLVVTGTSSDTNLVPAANMVFGGSGTNRTVTLTPAGFQTGSATITLTVGDGILTATNTFLFNVNPVDITALYSATLGKSPLILNGTNLELGFMRAKAAVTAGATYTVDWRDNLASGSWNTSGVSAPVILSDDGTNQQVKITVPKGSGVPQRFVRLRVARP